MDKLRAMNIFVRVVEMNGFANAANGLSMPPSTVSRVIKDLEAHLGARLLQRTTRTLSLTPDGTLYYDHCLRILSEVNAVESSLSGSTAPPRGRLRVDMTASFARRVVLPAVSEFQHRYPEIDLILTLGDRPVDLVQEGIDCVVRAGVPDSSAVLVARQIGSFEWVTCASPEYLKQHGEPKSLEDLDAHRVIEFLSGRTGRSTDWRFLVDDEERTVRVSGSLAVNDTDAYVTCGLQGLGLIRIADFIALPYFQDGRLVNILGDYRAPEVPLCILYPQNRHLSPAVRAFVGWISLLVREAEPTWRLFRRGELAKLE
ncbi:LysR family transcriptional regulator [Allopusillimonas ginsengisoli]|uniref:LysR family transcriptional regulator n=1 Tax=Allopusillimonas ginsengisoli TaxID=453575 RepID=UPI001020B35F|nr:LysR family transcriptional regulator [Allopusillimonas ginsengisoli]TEA78786.1 LysR family transcriptional regulator [Allopusillimonas ginsengisoli]